MSEFLPQRKSLILLLLFVAINLCLMISGSGKEHKTSPPPASEQTPTAEFRGLWITRFEWPNPDPEKCKQKIIEIFQNMADANFNAAVFQIRGEAEVLYPSTLEPWSPLIGGKDPGFDPLQFAIEEAHKRNIQFHAYINPIPLRSWNRGTTPTHTIPEHMYYQHGPDSAEPWVCVDKDGKIMDARAAGYFYFSPGIPQVQSYLRQVILDVVKRYDVDGIHLDRIRYPGPQYSYDKISRHRFFTRGNPNLKEWADWQREQLNKFINDLKAEIMAVKPHVALSCSAWGIYNRYHLEGYHKFSSGFHDYYQDSWEWVRLGAMDFLIPMIYWNIPDPKPNYDELLKDFVNGLGAQYIVGGQRTYGEEWNADENITEIKITRELGALGTNLFAYGSTKERGLFEKLKTTLYQTPAPVPPLEKLAKSGYGVILGTVTDEEGQPLVDAWVSLKTDSQDKAITSERVFNLTWVSGADGRFAFLKVPPVPVTVVVEYDGAEKTEIKDLTINPGEVKTITVAVKGAREARNQVFFHIFSPEDGLKTSKNVVHLLGRTAPDTKIKVNDKEVEVYPTTGAFAMDNIPLQPGINTIAITATAPDGNTTTRFITVTRILEEKTPTEIKSVTIEQPAENIALKAGDILDIRVKGPRGWQGIANCWNGKVRLPLSEIVDEEYPTTGTHYYAASYKIPAGFQAKPSPIKVELASGKGLSKKKLIATSKATVEVWNETEIKVGKTIAESSGITFGIHYVRLGGPYLAEVPEDTRFEIIGRTGDKYKIRLSRSLTGWISAEDVQLLPAGTSVPHPVFTSCSIDGDEKYDKIRIPLSEKIVYAITPEIEPYNCLKVDLFNTHRAMTWISHKSGAKFIGAVTCEQIEDDWVRIHIPLKFRQNWGFWVEQDKGGITIFIKRPPKIASPPDSPVKGLTFALEAGHGGTNSGAVGTMGTKEKTINATAVALLQKALEERGAKTVLMRVGDSMPTLERRVQIAIEADADFIISIHANAAGTERGFLRVSGTSTYYKYKHCYLPAKLVYDELLKLGWGEFGVVGDFNYYPLRNTRIPAILIEQAFMSNPYDEARMLDPAYQEAQTTAIIKGIEAFLNSIRE